MKNLEKELEQSYIIKCRGAGLPSDKLYEPVKALLRVFKDGEVKVSCEYYDSTRDKGESSSCNACIPKDNIKCIYRELK